MNNEIPSIFAEASQLRHQLHRFPEIAGEEFKTAAELRKRISQIPNVELLPPYLQTDVVAVVRGTGTGSGSHILLRADIDALPIEEHSGLPFASEISGMMHACGHDLHTASLYGALKYVAAHRDKFSGVRRFVWQPGEECKAMARQLIDAGVLNDRPDMAVAMHVGAGVEENKLTTVKGATTAGSIHFHVIFRGKSGHGSRPHCANNPINAAAAAILALQGAILNNLDSREAASLSIGRIHGGNCDNAIPETAEIGGTVRIFSQTNAEIMQVTLKRVCESCAATYGVKSEVSCNYVYPPGINHDDALAHAIKAAKLANLDLEVLDKPSLGAEDFAYFQEKIPGIQVTFGGGVSCPALHSDKFCARDESMLAPIKFLISFAFTE